MYRHLCISLLLAGLFSSTLRAQDLQKKKSSEPAPMKEPSRGKLAARTPSEEGIPGEVDVFFLNGSKVRMIIESDRLDISTLYGKVSVPIQDVQAIEFGLHYPEGIVARIDMAVKNLGNSDYREREKAAKTLVDLGPYSYPAVLKASRTKESEVSQRAKAVVQKLQTKHSKKDLKITTDDKVVTPTQTIVGRIMTTSVKTRADYFGNIEHKLENMRMLRIVAGAGRELEVSVDASKYANQGQWMETNYQVDGRSGIVVTAKGQVDTWPQQPGQYMSGPGGGQVNRGMPNGAMIVRGQRIVAGQINGQIYGGMLLGKIGEDGEPFVIGDRYEGNPEAEGKLYLHIGPSPWNCASAGQYEVKITRKNE